jgi:L-cysteine:1D-myo-inositol 2-amino-2-deoxy-alpha-D-glucopyranoside ligase
MRSWNRPTVPRLPGSGSAPRLFDSSTDALADASADGTATLYVCGITPYDATHLGHAATYLAFDTLVRVWLDAGYTVRYAQNTTDVDDPLLERATATGVDWRELAEQQTELYRSDMAALGVVPPDDFVPVTAVIPEVADAVAALMEAGYGYRVPTTDSIGGADDVYFDSAAAVSSTSWHLGLESGLDRDTMLELSALRGGDPDRPGKRDRLDPLLWRAARAGEPSWPTVLGAGRPGWHIECSVIAMRSLGTSITVQGGGSDLVFPHHEFSAGHATALSGAPFARVYAHAGMVAYQGEKMSKSLGNLVLVSRLLEDGVDARAIRLAILAHHYRSDWEYTAVVLADAESRLQRWREWAALAETREGEAPDALLAALRSALADDLDVPAALREVDRAAEDGVPATAAAVDGIHALLGIDLRAA